MKDPCFFSSPYFFKFGLIVEKDWKLLYDFSSFFILLVAADTFYFDPLLTYFFPRLCSLQSYLNRFVPFPEIILEFFYDSLHYCKVFNLCFEFEFSNFLFEPLYFLRSEKDFGLSLVFFLSRLKESFLAPLSLYMNFYLIIFRY